MSEQYRQQRQSLGHAFIAYRPCGRVSGMQWVYGELKKQKNDYALQVMEWVMRGNAVKYVERFEGDPAPEFSWACACQDCETKGKAWTQTLPKEPGYYWRKTSPTGKPRIVRAVDRNGVLKFLLFGIGKDYSADDADLYAQCSFWYGPIEPPELK